jgi:CRISPR-associated protein Csb2
MTQTVVEVQLLSGRYHAHVWGEAQFAMASAEWPPSPWRLLRALAAAWFASRPAPSTPVERDELLEALGRSGPPELWLPRTAFGELRYYQPIRLGGSDRVLHHDMFAIPEDGRFWFVFQTALTEHHQALLDDLLGRLRYFGRAESRAVLRTVEASEPPRDVFRALPAERTLEAANVMHHDVLCAADNFVASDLWAVREAGTRRSRTRRSQAASSGAAAHPRHLVEELLGKKKPLPDGARWIRYAVPRASLVSEIRRVSSPRAPDLDERITVAVVRFALNRRVPIPLADIVAVARGFRDAAVRSYEQLSGGVHSVALTGLDPDGSPVKGHHHVYYLPRRVTDGPAVDRLDVVIPGGSLARGELEALLNVETIRLRPGDPYPITVLPQEVEASYPARRAAERWRSATPFLSPLRHRTGRTATLPEQQLARLLGLQYGEHALQIKRTSGPGGHGVVTQVLAHNYADRRRPPMLISRVGFWFELSFPRPVTLRYPVGADAHFGLGQFEPF